MALNLLLLGVAIAVSPLSLILFLGLLSTQGGTRRALGFVVGWVLSLSTVIILTLLVTDGTPVREASTPSQIVLGAEILLGLGMVWWARRTQRAAARRDDPSPEEPPRQGGVLGRLEK